MSMDPTKWTGFSELSNGVQQKIEAVYPYLKIDQCIFQEKASGVFMRQNNSVKIEKLLDPQKVGADK